MDNTLSDVIKYKDMEIMIKKGIIKCNEQEISLTKNEMMKLLVGLIQAISVVVAVILELFIYLLQILIVGKS